MTETSPPHVVIISAGFGGLSAVAGLRRAGARVTIIDKNLYSAFQPLLYQVATGGLNPGDIAYPVGGFAARRGTRYIWGKLAAIDSGGRILRLDDGREFSYDYLVISTRVAAHYFGLPGAAKHTFGGDSTAAFAHHDRGIMATIGRRSAVVQIPKGPSSPARSPGWPGSRCTWPTCWGCGTGSRR
jgi:NADH dehydrogenase FAD-containing subunit